MSHLFLTQELDNIGNGYGPLEDDNNFKAGAGAGNIKTCSSRKLKFVSRTISVFATVGEINDSSVEGLE